MTIPSFLSGHRGKCENALYLDALRLFGGFAVKKFRSPLGGKVHNRKLSLECNEFENLLSNLWPLLMVVFLLAAQR